MRSFVMSGGDEAHIISEILSGLELMRRSLGIKIEKIATTRRGYMALRAPGAVSPITALAERK